MLHFTYRFAFPRSPCIITNIHARIIYIPIHMYITYTLRARIAFLTFRLFPRTPLVTSSPRKLSNVFFFFLFFLSVRFFFFALSDAEHTHSRVYSCTLYYLGVYCTYDIYIYIISTIDGLAACVRAFFSPRYTYYDYIILLYPLRPPLIEHTIIYITHTHTHTRR